MKFFPFLPLSPLLSPHHTSLPFLLFSFRGLSFSFTSLTPCLSLPSLPTLVYLLLPQWFSPLSCHQLLGPGLLRMGRLWLRSPSHAGPAPGLWLSGFGLLRGDHLFLCPAPGPGPPAPEDMVHLRRLQEISKQGCGQGF